MVISFYKVFIRTYIKTRGPGPPRKKNWPLDKKLTSGRRGQFFIWGPILFPGGPGPNLFKDFYLKILKEILKKRKITALYNGNSLQFLETNFKNLLNPFLKSKENKIIVIGYFQFNVS